MAKAVKEQVVNSTFQDKLKELEKKYGSGSIITGKDVTEKVEVVSTGSINLDIATNLMGLPVGKLVEYQGMESSGKSTAALHNIAEFQKIKGVCVLCDYEQSFDKIYATSVGCKVDELIILQPENMEDGYNLIEELIKTGEVRLVVIDSHTAAMPKKVVEGEVGDASIGLQARINSQALGKIKPLLRDKRCTMIGISQIRQDIGSMGEVNKSTGGLAWKFYSDMRFKFAKVKTDKEHESNKTEVNIIKNKCASPWGKAVFSVNWGQGYDRLQEVIDIAVELKLLSKGGSWYTMDGGAKIQGDEGMKQFLKDNEEYSRSLEKQVLDSLQPQQELITTE